MKIVQLSDLHLTLPGAELFGSAPLARLELAIDRILENHADADFCLLTGDLADAGGDATYASLAEALRRLPMPAHLLPGNHDSREALRRHFPQLANNDGGFMQAALATPGGHFLLLDTMEPGAPWGNYCIQRREWLAQQLAAASQPCPARQRQAQPRVVLSRSVPRPKAANPWPAQAMQAARG